MCIHIHSSMAIGAQRNVCISTLHICVLFEYFTSSIKKGSNPPQSALVSFTRQEATVRVRNPFVSSASERP